MLLKCTKDKGRTRYCEISATFPVSLYTSSSDAENPSPERKPQTFLNQTGSPQSLGGESGLKITE